MLLAIDVGNSQTVFGLWDGVTWRHVWRRATRQDTTEDEFAAWLHGLFFDDDPSAQIDGIVVASVVPGLDATMRALSSKHFPQATYHQVQDGKDVGLTILYEPPSVVGADRIANALGALALVTPPVIVVDFGTATTFDAIDAAGAYAGGAILPGPLIAAQALNEKTAKLPQVELAAPPSALGRNTRHALQSGLVLGYAAAIEGLARQITEELGEGVTILATGGLGEIFTRLCSSIRSYEPTLTLDGLRIARDLLRASEATN